MIEKTTISIEREDSRVQRALWVRVDGKLRWSLRLVHADGRYPAVLKLSRGQGAGYIGGWTAHLRLGKYRWPDQFGYGRDRPLVGVTRNANRWL